MIRLWALFLCVVFFFSALVRAQAPVQPPRVADEVERTATEEIQQAEEKQADTEAAKVAGAGDSAEKDAGEESEKAKNENAKKEDEKNGKKAEDVFIPTEQVSEDVSVAFPVDI